MDEWRTFCKVSAKRLILVSFKCRFVIVCYNTVHTF